MTAPRCWAECLGGCSDKISREHLISQSLFQSEDVSVHGFPWCMAEPMKIGLPSLVAKILCQAHNSQLSDVDSAGAKAFDALREQMRVSNVRAKMTPRIWQVVRYDIDGPLLERWFLKTLINLALGREYRIGKDSTNTGQPSKRLVEIAFGVAKFEERIGLSVVAQVGRNIQSDDTVSFAPLIIEGSYVTGGLFAFRGIKLFLSLDDPSLTQIPQGIVVAGEDWSLSQLNFHNTEIREVSGTHLSQVVHWHW